MPNAPGLAWARQRGVAVAIIRIAGIYGPGANALETLKAGRARRIVKPGQVFNRIHVADLAEIVDKAITRRADGVFNAADDEPTAPGDPIVFRRRPARRRANRRKSRSRRRRKTMSPFAISFYGESKRVRNDPHQIGARRVAALTPPIARALRALAEAMPALD